MADSSFIAEGLLKRKELLEEDQMVAPELVLYEVANSVWKHEYLLGDLKEGAAYLSILYGLVDAGRIAILFPDVELMKRCYEVAGRNGVTIYDAIFVALAIDLGVKLRTFDKKLTRVMKAEGAREQRKRKRPRASVN